MVGGNIREIVYDADGQVFLKRELIGLCMDRYYHVKVHNCTCGPMSILVWIGTTMSKYTIAHVDQCPFTF